MKSGPEDVATPELCAQEFLEVVPAAMWFIRRQMRQHRRGLSVPQFRLLVQVDRQPMASLSTLADTLGASAPTASRMVAGLTTRGLLRRRESTSDRRQISIELTPRGRDVLETARAATLKTVAIELAQLSGDERRLVHQSMDLLKHVLEPLRSDARSEAGIGPLRVSDAAGVDRD